MADTKISDLSALTTADPDNDMLVVVDDSDTTMAASGTDKRIVVSDLVKTVGAGDNAAINSTENPLGTRMQIYHGTAASPITTGPGNVLRVSKRDGIAQATRDGWTGVTAGQQSTDDTAALCGSSYGSAASQLQVTGVCGVAQNAGTTDGGVASSGPDACGLFGYAYQHDSGAIGRAIGAYLAGRRDVTTAAISGCEIQCQNRAGVDDSYNATTTPTTVGLLMGAGSATGNTRGCGIYFNHGTGSPRYDVGIGFTSNDSGPCTTATIRDDGNAVTSIDINGSHTDAINLAGATLSGGALVLGAAHNIVLDTATGTKIGTGTTQRLGFWNATPIVKPTNTITLTNYTAGSRSFNRSSYTMDGLADVVCEIVKQLGDTAGVGLVNDA